MAGILSKALTVGIGLMVLFLLGSTLILPNFSSAWRYCQARSWNADEGGALDGTNCSTPYTNTNSTPISAAGSHTESGLTSPINADITDVVDIDYFCLNCDTAGGYRSTVQGLVLLALSLALIGFAIYFFPRRTM